VVTALLGTFVAVTAVGCSLEASGRAPRDCAELLLQEPGASSGVRTLAVEPRSRPRDVYCEMDLGGGGWTLWPSPDAGTLPANEGMPRCGALYHTDCVAGTYVQRGLRDGLFLVFADSQVFELAADLRLTAVSARTESHEACPTGLSCDGGSSNCLFSTLIDGPGCCVDGPQVNFCLE